MFKNNRIHRHVTTFKTSHLHSVCVDVINLRSFTAFFILLVTPQKKTRSYGTDYSVYKAFLCQNVDLIILHSGSNGMAWYGTLMSFREAGKETCEFHLGRIDRAMYQNYGTWSNNCCQPYKHTTCISRWNDEKTVVFTSFQRETHVVCL